MFRGSSAQQKSLGSQGLCAAHGISAGTSGKSSCTTSATMYKTGNEGGASCSQYQCGIPFFFRRKRDKVNWRLIGSVDITRIQREVDVSTLQDVVDNVTFCDIESEDLRYLDPNFVRLFQLAQLIIEYLLYCQSVLQESEKTVASKANILNDELVMTKEQTEKQLQELYNLRKERKTLKKALYAYQLMSSIPTSSSRHQNFEKNLKSDANFQSYSKSCQEPPLNKEKCRFCSKTFQGHEYLELHYRRRHADKISKAKMPKNGYVENSENTTETLESANTSISQSDKSTADRKKTHSETPPSAQQHEQQQQLVTKLSAAMDELSHRLLEAEAKMRTEMERHMHSELDNRSTELDARMRRELELRVRELDNTRLTMNAEIAAEKGQIAGERAVLEALRKDMLVVQKKLHEQSLQLQEQMQTLAKMQNESVASASLSSMSSSDEKPYNPPQHSGPSSGLGILEDDSEVVVSPPVRRSVSVRDTTTSTENIPPPVPAFDAAALSNSILSTQEKTLEAVRHIVATEIAAFKALLEKKQAETTAKQQLPPSPPRPVEIKICPPAVPDPPKASELRTVIVEELPAKKTPPPSPPLPLNNAPLFTEQPQVKPKPIRPIIKIENPVDAAAPQKQVSEDTTQKPQEKQGSGYNGLYQLVEEPEEISYENKDYRNDWETLSRHLRSHKYISLIHAPWVKSAASHQAINVMRAREGEKENLMRNLKSLCPNLAALSGRETHDNIMQKIEAERESHVNSDPCFGNMFDYISDEIDEIVAQNFKFKPKPILMRTKTRHRSATPDQASGRKPRQSISVASANATRRYSSAAQSPAANTGIGGGGGGGVRSPDAANSTATPARGSAQNPHRPSIQNTPERRMSLIGRKVEWRDEQDAATINTSSGSSFISSAASPIRRSSTFTAGDTSRRYSRKGLQQGSKTNSSSTIASGGRAASPLVPHSGSESSLSEEVNVSGNVPSAFPRRVSTMISPNSTKSIPRGSIPSANINWNRRASAASTANNLGTGKPLHLAYLRANNSQTPNDQVGEPAAAAPQSQSQSPLDGSSSSLEYESKKRRSSASYSEMYSNDERCSGDEEQSRASSFKNRDYGTALGEYTDAPLVTPSASFKSVTYNFNTGNTPEPKAQDQHQSYLRGARSGNYQSTSPSPAEPTIKSASLSSINQQQNPTQGAKKANPPGSQNGAAAQHFGQAYSSGSGLQINTKNLDFESDSESKGAGALAAGAATLDSGYNTQNTGSGGASSAPYSKTVRVAEMRGSKESFSREPEIAATSSGRGAQVSSLKQKQQEKRSTESYTPNAPSEAAPAAGGSPSSNVAASVTPSIVLAAEATSSSNGRNLSDWDVESL